MKPEKKLLFPVHELIAQRWSPRSFSDEPVAEDKIASFFEAARWAASSMNEQPWFFIAGNKYKNRASWDKIYNCLIEFNQSWAHRAPVLLLTFISTKFDKNKRENRTAMHDLGLAVGNLTMQAMSDNLYLHQMGGIDKEKIKNTFKLPVDVKPATAIAIGYPGDPELLDDKLKQTETARQNRKDLTEMVFSDEWGNAYDFNISR